MRWRKNSVPRSAPVDCGHWWPVDDYDERAAASRWASRRRASARVQSRRGWEFDTRDRPRGRYRSRSSMTPNDRPNRNGATREQTRKTHAVPLAAAAFVVLAVSNDWHAFVHEFASGVNRIALSDWNKLKEIFRHQKRALVVATLIVSCIFRPRHRSSLCGSLYGE